MHPTYKAHRVAPEASFRPWRMSIDIASPFCAYATQNLQWTSSAEADSEIFERASVFARSLKATGVDSFSLDDWRRCGEFGLLGLSVPADFGGGGFGGLTTAAGSEIRTGGSRQQRRSLEGPSQDESVGPAFPGSGRQPKTARWTSSRRHDPGARKRSALGGRIQPSSTTATSAVASASHRERPARTWDTPKACRRADSGRPRQHRVVPRINHFWQLAATTTYRRTGSLRKTTFTHLVEVSSELPDATRQSDGHRPTARPPMRRLRCAHGGEVRIARGGRA